MASRAPLITGFPLICGAETPFMLPIVREWLVDVYRPRSPRSWWPVLTRPRVAGFQVSTGGRAAPIERNRVDSAPVSAGRAASKKPATPPRGGWW